MRIGPGRAISKAIVDDNGDHITATNPGRDPGGAFTIRLPASEAPAIEAA
jgi:K+-sensing histidine kinase KdpD